MLPSVGVLGAVFGASEAVLAVFKKSRGTDGTADSGSLRMLWIVIVCCMAVATLLSPAELMHGTMYVTGFAVFAFGAVLRWYSIFYLGRFFTVDVQVSVDHQLIDSGPYRFIRHPSYTGILFEFLGFGLCLGNWLSVLIIIVPVGAAFLYRIRVEESALARGLGERYVTYCSRTKRLIPFVY
jgi:protein-S-isoprenylcysteine O-methyltransferase